MEEVEGSIVAKGNHVVPKGVAVEELDGGKKKLHEKCPPELEALLNEKQCKPIYDKLVQAIVDESNTRNVFGKWRDEEFVSVLELFEDEFADHGIKVALCKRSSGSGRFRWLEFIDVEKLPDYVPQFDVANCSGQIIKTIYCKLEFPSGVAVEELNRYGKARLKLKTKIPIYVEKMLVAHDLMEEYQALVEHLANDGVSTRLKFWNIKKLRAVLEVHRYKFQAKGMDVFLSHKQEWVSHGQHGGHMEYFRWLEFVDRDEQPNYHPQRDVESNEEKCAVM